MRSIGIAILIGALAGVVDVAPMVLRGLDRFSCVSAFVFWCVQGLVISRMDLSLAAWLKGLVVAELSALPILVMVAGTDPAAVPAVAATSAVLGAAVGSAASRFARR